METYKTLKKAIIDLQRKGYDQDFSFKDGCFWWIQENEYMKAEEVEIDACFSFPNKQVPRSTFNIYALRHKYTGIQAMLLITTPDTDLQNLTGISSIPMQEA